MELEDFYKYWRETHTQVSAKIPGLRKYVQNRSIDDQEGNPAAFDGFSEMWFDDAEAFAVALETPEGQAALADTENFIDLERMLTLSVDEIDIV